MSGAGQRGAHIIRGTAPQLHKHPNVCRRPVLVPIALAWQQLSGVPSTSAGVLVAWQGFLPLSSTNQEVSLLTEEDLK